MAVPWPSRSHLGSDLAQPFHTGQFSRYHVSCHAAPGAQVRLVIPAHLVLTKMHSCRRAAAAQQQISQMTSLLRGTWLVLDQGGGCSWPERARLSITWNQQIFGSHEFGDLDRPHTTFVHALTVPKSLAPNHRARRKGPTGSSKDSEKVSLEARRCCKGETRLPQVPSEKTPHPPAPHSQERQRKIQSEAQNWSSTSLGPEQQMSVRDAYTFTSWVSPVLATVPGMGADSETEYSRITFSFPQLAAKAQQHHLPPTGQRREK